MPQALTSVRRSSQRPLSANLTDAQRRALVQFLDGQISAGALSRRLEAARGDVAPAPPAGARTPTRGSQTGRRASRRVLVAPIAVLAILIVGAAAAWAGGAALTGPARHAARQHSRRLTASVSGRHRDRPARPRTVTTSRPPAPGASAQEAAIAPAAAKPARSSHRPAPARHSHPVGQQHRDGGFGPAGARHDHDGQATRRSAGVPAATGFTGGASAAPSGASGPAQTGASPGDSQGSASPSAQPGT